MTDKIEAFITEVRNMPGFVAASATDPKWIAELEALERLLNALDRQADDDPGMIEIFDKIQSVVGRADLPIKQRLLEVGKLLAQVRDAIKIVH
jgi:hypothetical protein